MTSRFRPLLVAIPALLLAIVLGCAAGGGTTDGGGGTGGVNGGDGGSGEVDGGNGGEGGNAGANGGTTAELTDEQLALVRLLAGKQIHLMEALGVLAIVAEPDIIPTTNTTTTTGTCPVVTAQREDLTIGVTLGYDILAACDNAWGSISGPVNVLVDHLTPLFTVTYEYSHVNGQFLKGTFMSTSTLPDLGGTIEPGSASEDLKEWQGTIALQDTDTVNVVLDVEGGINVVFDPDVDRITMNSAGLYVLKEEVDKFETTAVNVRVEPVGRNSYVPYNGTLTITPYEDNSWFGAFTTLVIEFDEDSAATGVFHVSFDGGPVTDVTLE